MPWAPPTGSAENGVGVFAGSADPPVPEHRPRAESLAGVPFFVSPGPQSTRPVILKLCGRQPCLALDAEDDVPLKPPGEFQRPHLPSHLRRRTQLHALSSEPGTCGCRPSKELLNGRILPLERPHVAEKFISFSYHLSLETLSQRKLNPNLQEGARASEDPRPHGEDLRSKLTLQILSKEGWLFCESQSIL